MLLHQGIGHGAGGVFFRREVWGDLQFPVGILYEDYAVMYRAIARCAKVEVFPEPMYDYRIHTGSTMKSGIAEKNLVILDVGEDVTRFIAETVPVLKAEAEYLQLVTYLKTLKGILDGGFCQLSGGSGTDLPLCAGTPGACRRPGKSRPGSR